MTTKKHVSRIQPADANDRALTDWAKSEKPSIRWSPSQRQRWRAVDRELALDFEPRRKDDQDLRWYFDRGPAGDRDGTPDVRKRWNRIDRWLDGAGHALMAHYTQSDMRRKTQQYRVRGLDSTYAVNGPPHPEELAADYRRYLRNTVKGYAAANWAPYIVVSEQEFCALVQVVRPANETFKARTRSEDRSYFAQRPSEAIDTILLDVERSTWGDIRVDADRARLLLEMTCGVSYVEARALATEQALALLRGKLARAPKWIGRRLERQEVEEPGKRRRIAEDLDRIDTEQTQIKELLSDDQTGRNHTEPTETFGSHIPRIIQWTGTEGQALMPGTWDPRKIEVNNGRPFGTVSEIANRLRLPSKWVREALLSLQCPGIRAKSSAIPIEWFSSEKGRDFWQHAYRQQGKLLLENYAAARLARGGGKR